jgi:hypothetical protein
MLQFKNVMEVFVLLEKNNCKKCYEKTCMAFAAAVYKGNRQIGECPLVSDEIAARYGAGKKRVDFNEDGLEETVNTIKRELLKNDFTIVSDRIGAVFDGQKMILKILGKNFNVDLEGNIHTDIHVNSWVLGVILRYIVNCKGLSVEENWMPFREFPGGRDLYGLFAQQSEKPLKKLADKYPDLLADMVELFSGGQVSDQYQSDIAVILSPLPRVPMLICYWKAEDGMESSLTLFFDATAEQNIGTEGLYQLGTGLTQMFKKIALQHV